MESHDAAFKDLPTKELKLRRSQSRKESPTFPHIRPRVKSCTSPTLDTDVERSLSDRSVSSSPEGISLHLSPNSAFQCYRKYMPRIDSLLSPPILTEASTTFCDLSVHSSDTDPDQPLDMSTKRPPSGTSIHTQQQHRPSVITCASALLRTQCNVEEHHVCNLSNCNSDNDNEKQEDSRTGHRREVVAGSCDPVIDEHFRRSLGKDYPQIFSSKGPTNNSVSITVDDHFAKALGDTWLQLQQSSPESPPQPQTKSLHTGQQSHFLKHSPEIVSS